MTLAATALLLFVVGYGYLALLGVATSVLLMPRRWLPYAGVVAPHLGWAALVAVGYPLNAMWPFSLVAPLLGAAALTIIAAWVAGAGRPARGRSERAGWGAVPWRRWLGWRPLWREGGPPALLGLLVYLVAAGVHIRQGALSVLVADSDVEHFADVIAALLRSPIGWSVPAQRGLEATPVGLAYHYVHASLSALTGLDTFTTALPSHFLLLTLGVSGVYVFARSFLRLPAGAAILATALYAGGALPLIVASFGWGQQTAALAAVPAGLAALRVGIEGREARSLWTAGLLGALAAGSLYLASAPLVGGAAGTLALAGMADRPARRHAGWPVIRLLGIGLVVAAAGLLSHLSALSFLQERAAAGLLRADELSGRSTHIFAFAGAAELLGAAPLDLFRDVSALDGRPLLSWPTAIAPLAVLGAGAGAALVGAGALRWQRARPHLPATLVVVILYWAYLRWVRPFPYGEFKLLSSVWFLVPCLVVAGGLALSRSRVSLRAPPPQCSSGGSLQRWEGRRPLVGGDSPVPPLAPRRGGRTMLRQGACSAAVAGFALSLSLVWWHSLRFLLLPWGGLLPEGAMAEARSLVRAVPPGASVYVSSQLTPEVARASTGELTLHRAGFPSASARAGYMARRWRGVVTHLLAFGDRPPYGLVQRHSAELRAAVWPQATDYLLLDVSEDPRLYGSISADLAGAAGTLRLYRQGGGRQGDGRQGGGPARRPLLTLEDLPRPGVQAAPPAAPHSPADGHAAPERAPQAAPAAGPLLRLRATGQGLVLLQGAQERPVPPRSSPLPPPVLPIGESLPGRRRSPAAPAESPPALSPHDPVPSGAITRERDSPSGSSSAAGATAGHLLIGLQAIAPTHVRVALFHPDGNTSHRDLALTPGLTWYTTPAVRWPIEAELTMSPTSRETGASDSPAAASPTRATVRPAAVLVVPQGDGVTAEGLERSPSGALWPLLTVTSEVSPVDGTLSLDVWYTHFGLAAGSALARLHDAPSLWLGGDALLTNLHPGPGGRSWQVDLTPEERPRQRASDGREAPLASAWNRGPGRRWLWLEIGPHLDAALHEPPLLELQLAGEATRILPPGAPAVALPLLAGPAPLPAVADGTLVRGTGDDLFYVEGGKLRWVPSIEVLERRAIPWRLTVLEDNALWRLPVDLPLT